MANPIVNITIPVFNRYHLTQKTLLALRKTAPCIAYAVTVVDNGSEQSLRDRLVELHKDGIIDNLFLLPRNMGISCACNIGWRAVDAPYYMKLDNDMAVITPHWLENLFRLWAHGAPVSTLGPTFTAQDMVKNPGTITSEDGILGICTSNLMGSAIVIPKSVSDMLGYWSEDYGLYGADDGDYGARMNCAGLPQYYYDANDFFVNGGKYDNSEYEDTDLNKGKEHARLFKDESGGIGLFVLNYFLYNMCVRNWKVPLRYRIRDMDGYNVVLEEDPAYALIQQALSRSKNLLDNLVAAGRNNDMYSDAVVNRLKRIWEGCGQECTPL
ncbi:glycosyltransferase [Desulfovibrio desulfuricans]|uniref:glycosyltransferase n=1 Tax=Desulfovibrio desulfuricans TaxID=876 RepID=UPI0039845E53